MAYSFDQIFAADPANPSNVAQNASVTIFAPGDGTMTPLTITDPDGQPLANPLTVNANGFGSAFAHATLDRVAWAGGGFTGFFTSYEGMKNEAVEAREAAEAAAATAGTDAAAVATAAIGTATDEATAAAASAATAQAAAASAANAAANSAALVGAPADSAIAAAINAPASATARALTADILYKSGLSSKLGSFFTALGNRLATPTEVLYLGDSLTEGLGATTRASRTVDRARDALRSRYPTTGAKGGVGFIPAWYATNTFPDPWTNSGVAHNGTGLGLRSDGVGVGGTKTITVTGTSVDIIWAKTTGTSSFSYTVDGGSATTVNVGSAGSFTDGFRTRVTLGASGSHTLVITGVTGTTYIAGIYVYDGDETKGIHVWEGGHSGFKVSDITGSWATSGAAITSINPHLVVAEYGANELAGNVTPATFKTNLQTLIANIKAGVTTTPSFLLVASQEHSTTFTYPWSDYKAKMQEVADADSSVAFLDLTRYMPKVTVPDTTGWYIDTIHLSNAGHEQKAMRELGILGEVSVSPAASTGPEPYKLLATAFRDSAADQTITPGTTFNDIDGTGLKLDFIVPGSGKVIIRASAPFAATGPAGIYLGLRKSGVDVAGTASRCGYIGAAGTGIQGQAQKQWILTGLTPGDSVSYTLAAKREGAGTCQITFGQAGGWGQITFTAEG